MELTLLICFAETDAHIFGQILPNHENQVPICIRKLWNCNGHLFTRRCMYYTFVNAFVFWPGDMLRYQKFCFGTYSELELLSIISCVINNYFLDPHFPGFII